MTVKTSFHAYPEDRVMAGASVITGSAFITLTRGDTPRASAVQMFLDLDQARAAHEQLGSAIRQIEAHRANRALEREPTAAEQMATIEALDHLDEADRAA